MEHRARHERTVEGMTAAELRELRSCFAPLDKQPRFVNWVASIHMQHGYPCNCDCCVQWVKNRRVELAAMAKDMEHALR